MNRSSLRTRGPRPGARCPVWRSAAAAALLGLLLTAGAANAQCSAPEVLVQPTEQTVCPGHLVTFTAEPTGTHPLTITWRESTDGGISFHDVTPEDTSTTLSFTASLSQNGNIYQAFVVNNCGFQTGSATLTVQDNRAPLITSLSATPSALWPPNNKMVLVTVHIAATDNCGSAMSQIVSVTNNETGSADEQIVDATHVWLRATRLGNGHGRVYTIKVAAMDTSGNMAPGTVTVTVPHDQGH